VNNAEIETALAAASAEVLETMFFAEVLGAAPPPAAGIAARVVFRGSPPGAFSMAIDSAAARALAAGFLALDESELSEPRVGEVVCELANMICGSVLSRLEPDAAFELLHPELIAPVAAAAPARFLDLGAGALAVSIEFQPRV
jgi:CheY-specific phosphatase CheX